MTLRNLLDERAAGRPHDLAYAFLAGDKLQQQWDYAGLRQQVARVEAFLNNSCASGSRALLVYPQGLEFMAAFLACLCQNVVAVPVPAPETYNLRRSLPRLKAISDDAQAAVVLTTRRILDLLSANGDQAAWDFKAIPWIATDELPDEPATDSDDHTIPPQELAYLQYTSGSTSTPSGVMITHQNLMHHLQTLHTACGYGDGVTVTWMPHFHDYGLVQGLLQPLFSGDPCYVMSPLSFMKRPAHWLGAISKYAGTHSQAPNFAYDHCVRRIRPKDCAALNLSSWKAAGNAAEPINPLVLDSFASTFEPYGFRKNAFSPAFGLAEATLLVSSTPLGSGPYVIDLDAASLETGRVVLARDGNSVRKAVSCGQLVGNTRVAIVDPDSLSASSVDVIGEIWVSDPAVAAGYWDQPEKSAATFQAHLSDTGEGPWLRTGDLGFMRDGHLFVSGRLKDLIIIRGANFAPQDLEWIAQGSHPALEETESAAFSVMINGDERLVIIQELKRNELPADADIREIAAGVRQAIAEEFDIRAYAVALVRRGAILKTSSGKIQRRACRAGLLDGSLETIDLLSEGPLPPAQVKA